LLRQRADRQVDDVDLIPLTVGDHPVDAGNDIADVAGAVRAKHFHAHQLRARRDAAAAGFHGSRSRPDADDMPAAPPLCRAGPFRVDHVQARANLTAQLRDDGDAGVEDGDADIAAGYGSAETGPYAF